MTDFIRPEALTRFHSNYATSDGCWQWTSTINKDGYGQFKLQGKAWIASRLAYLIEHGSIPAGLMVLHHCDNRRCVRPSHLYAGTNDENMRDMVNRGRSTRGMWRGKPVEPPTPAAKRAHRGRKLSPEQITLIRTSDKRSTVLAQELGVCRQMVNAIRRGAAWKQASNL